MMHFRALTMREAASLNAVRAGNVANRQLSPCKSAVEHGRLAALRGAMTDVNARQIALPLGWEYLEPDEAAARLAELKRELPPGHLLFGVSVETFASRIGDDDTLFRHVGDSDRFTVVHLTWLGREEINAEHPTVDFDGTLTKFLAREQRIIAESG